MYTAFITQWCFSFSIYACCVFSWNFLTANSLVSHEVHSFSQYCYLESWNRTKNHDQINWSTFKKKRNNKYSKAQNLSTQRAECFFHWPEVTKNQNLNYWNDKQIFCVASDVIYFIQLFDFSIAADVTVFRFILVPCSHALTDFTTFNWITSDRNEFFFTFNSRTW